MSSTVFHFLNDPYETECDAVVLETQGGVVIVDHTVFYPGVGVSSPDIGTIMRKSGQRTPIIGAIWLGPDRTILGHVVDNEEAMPRVGETVRMEIDWDRRYRCMRTHTALHMVSVSFPFGIVGGKVGVGEGYIEFDADRNAMEEPVLENHVQRLIDRGLEVRVAWIAAGEVDPNCRSSRFRWPGAGDALRKIEIGGIDCQACDGLHVKNTKEVGAVLVTEIVQVGPSRRRVMLSLVNLEKDWLSAGKTEPA